MEINGEWKLNTSATKSNSLKWGIFDFHLLRECKPFYSVKRVEIYLLNKPNLCSIYGTLFGLKFLRKFLGMRPSKRAAAL